MQKVSCLALLPCRVVIDLWDIIRWGITCSREPCHLQEAPGHGQEYGRNSQVSSCSPFSVCRRDTAHPDVEYLHGNITVLATFSIAKLRMFPTMEMNVTTKKWQHQRHLAYSTLQDSQDSVLKQTWLIFILDTVHVHS
jgi:hypothetical protein